MSIPGDMVIELNFVPDWARRPAKESSYTRYEASRAGGRDGRENKRRPRETLDKSDNNRRYAKHGSRNTSRPDRVATASPPRLHETVGQGRSATPLARSLPACPPEYDNVGRPQSAGQGAAAGKRPQGSRKRPIPVKVTFIPESRGLKPLAARLRRSGRAYPLLEVAALFISKPDFYAVKHEVEPDGTGTAVLFLYQCAVCQAVFLDCNLTVAHALNRHLDLFYAREETTVEPPKGTFTAVARCPLSGELLGPPNYHQFNERLAELHSTRFAAMTLEAYRRQIVNEIDPALIEQWKKEASRQIVYRTLRAAEPLTFRRRSQMEAHFREHYAPAFIRRARRFITPGVACQDIEDPDVRQAVAEAWARENRFPLKMAVSIQSAFRRLGLHFFKASGKATFITAILPHAIDHLQATVDLRRMLECLYAHPGITRQELVKLLQPTAAPDALEVGTILQALRWLVEKGHIIEFYNGTLAVPGLPAIAPGATAGRKLESFEENKPAASRLVAGADPVRVSGAALG